MKRRLQAGLTLIELITVILVLAIVAVTAVPRFADVSREARISTLQGVVASMRSTINMVRAKARATGLAPVASNPGGNTQTMFVVDFPFGSSEVDWRNLCPESRAEVADALTMLDFMQLEGSGLLTSVDNRYTKVGYQLPAGVPTTTGCYVFYDSFGNPDCTVTLVDVDC